LVAEALEATKDKGHETKDKGHKDFTMLRY